MVKLTEKAKREILLLEKVIRHGINTAMEWVELENFSCAMLMLEKVKDNLEELIAVYRDFLEWRE